MNLLKKLFIPLVFLLIGFTIGNVFSQQSQSYIKGYTEQHSGQTKLINKLLDFDIPPSNELGPYKRDLENIVKKFMQEGKATQVSIYYRDLNNGPWIDVNGNQKFIPASLLKLPLMMVYLKKSEINPEILKKKYTFQSGESPVVTSKHYARNGLVDGKEYTVNDLIRRMIVNSDNDALYLLSTNVDVAEQKALFTKLGFPIPNDVTSSTDFMSPKNIASFFRVLYNATYLEEDTSEKALQLLTETDFPYGIVAGVPDSIVVAHKYGERSVNDETELHDCGIIYYPDHPYSLCVMTEGDDYENLANIIKSVSKFTYEKVKTSNK